MADTKVAIIAANGTLFDAYKVFNVATAAAASDAEVGISFTFEGLNLVHKEGHKNLPLPEGKEHFQEGFKQARGNTGINRLRNGNVEHVARCIGACVTGS